MKFNGTNSLGANMLGGESSWIRSSRVRIYLGAKRPEYELPGYEYTLWRIVLNTKLLGTNLLGDELSYMCPGGDVPRR